MNYDAYISTNTKLFIVRNEELFPFGERQPPSMLLATTY